MNSNKSCLSPWNVQAYSLLLTNLYFTAHVGTMETTLIHTFRKLRVANCLLNIYLCFIRQPYPQFRTVTLSRTYINIHGYLPLSFNPMQPTKSTPPLILMYKFGLYKIWKFDYFDLHILCITYQTFLLANTTRGEFKSRRRNRCGSKVINVGCGYVRIWRRNFLVYHFYCDSSPQPSITTKGCTYCRKTVCRGFVELLFFGLTDLSLGHT